jgi:hypothetical protein
MESSEKAALAFHACGLWSLFSPPTIFRRAGVHQRTAFNILLLGTLRVLFCDVCRWVQRHTWGGKRGSGLRIPVMKGRILECVLCLCRGSWVPSVLVASCLAALGEWMASGGTSLTLSPPPSSQNLWLSLSLGYQDLACSQHLWSLCSRC